MCAVNHKMSVVHIPYNTDSVLYTVDNEPSAVYSMLIPDICRLFQLWDVWRKICHVEIYQIILHDKCGEIWTFSTCGVISDFTTWHMGRNLTFLHMFTKFDFLHMTYVETEVSSHLYDVKNVFTCTHYAVLLTNWFCCDLRWFVMKSVLSQFTHFCVDKN